MRVDVNTFRRNRCTKCPKYTGPKPEFGKCPAGWQEIYRCARGMLAAKFRPDPPKEVRDELED
jgi:hypothetical protein